MFHGPPGSLKSVLLRHFAGLLGTALRIRVSKLLTTDTANQYNGQTEAKIRSKFSSLSKTGGIIECEDLEVKFVNGGEGEFFSWFGVFEGVATAADTAEKGGGKWAGKFGRCVHVGGEDIKGGVTRLLGKDTKVDLEGWSVWRAVKFCELVKERGGDEVKALEDLSMFDLVTLRE
ncbi:hypothetical protein TrRE_jg1695 [Triparma retinervis]|uniref:Uncharacterized protein n=1 Tax=Triparma retinervis TaxID=2557542 RepID=A0A9W7EDN4_9STRA|nr:hypothetical protein TrRE_jg1695 [Triparma retinervis]